jgi:hypothetical protein
MDRSARRTERVCKVEGSRNSHSRNKRWDRTVCHKCGWTSKYAYIYLKLLEREHLWPAQLPYTSISKALESAERMPDPIPEESSTACTYEYKHAAPEYRRNRRWSLDIFNKSIGLCMHCVRSDTLVIIIVGLYSHGGEWSDMAIGAISLATVSLVLYAYGVYTLWSRINNVCRDEE